MKDTITPAFPNAALRVENGQWAFCYAGMALRDWFAGMALQGMLAADISSDQDGLEDQMVDTPGNAAALAYKHADAMMAERIKP